jgi:hypothetical protein
MDFNIMESTWRKSVVYLDSTLYSSISLQENERVLTAIIPEDFPSHY